ncbi:MAG: TonB-dependent hemoglobin/transferrin/lactoferrin family receptor [Pseudorhodoplanes sp.]|nr:Heme/hemopexin utilization protein C [Pseudorhodoplanes sp.]MBW7949822.1 TonB-dependent hemoglobin/transferrin/lactoferrin family receptor [Pseudorhodoplanes sp.]MCL4713023.1 TonB-dependent hemoglobin/transferrin/lactoferrin family receptor [Pseudorhodoplanes sp.]MCQ3942685.1 TonB-dependent receptor [Alphaproteobacteria bacterium]GIK82335.1 MAG: TonB-dependent receptor [Alphaproteobacteria bacterium]
MDGHSARVCALALATGFGALDVTGAAAQSAQTLDAITVVATKTEEKAIDALANVTALRKEDIEQRLPDKVSDLFMGVPGVYMQERADHPETSINIRGLQDFGRVAVIVDGARQNFQRSGHNASGTFFLEPELLAGLDIVRGPVANIYGSGAIGGIASFRTKDVDDILRPGERYGAEVSGTFGSNRRQALGSVFVAARSAAADVIVGGTYRTADNYDAGNGKEVINSGKDVGTGLAKITVRPMEGHQIKFTGLNYDARYKSGQQIPEEESVYNSRAINQIASARWTYARPDDRLFNFDGSVYWTRTALEQTKIANGDPTALGNPITGFIGDSRSYKIDTTGFDLHNTTRFDTGALRHALTYGGDFFTDKIDNFDPTGSGNILTPDGTRTVWGSFAQLKTEYSGWLEIISAIRYDNYALEGTGFSSAGEHWSPKVTVGITPVAGLQIYGTFAEGYRAPAATETLVTGLHPAVGTTGTPIGGFGPGAFMVFNPLFTFLPNTNLRPEVGQTKEIGVNLKYDNIFRAGDKFRGKINVFQNDVEDYIEAVNFGSAHPIVQVCPANPPGCPPAGLITFASNTYSFTQYQNIGSARIRGIEADLNYDAGDWFLGIAGQHIRGRDLDHDAPLRTVQPDQLATTLGLRFLERKLTLGARWIAVAAKKSNDIPDTDNDGLPDVLPSQSYNLVNLFMMYQPTPDVTATFAVDNVADHYYVPYLSAEQIGPDGTPGLIFPGPGRTFKGALRIRFGAS